MKSVVLSNFHLPLLSIIALMLFFTLFLGVLFWVYRKSSNDVYREISESALQSEDN